jgi:hypothetical protein
MTTVKCCPTGGRTPPTHAFFLIPLLYMVSRYDKGGNYSKGRDVCDTKTFSGLLDENRG